MTAVLVFAQLAIMIGLFFAIRAKLIWILDRKINYRYVATGTIMLVALSLMGVIISISAEISIIVAGVILILPTAMLCASLLLGKIEGSSLNREN